MIVAPIGWAKEKYTTGFIQVFPDGGCVLNQKAIQCDRVPPRLRATNLSPGFSVLVAVDGAPYETVVTLLESLRQSGIRDVSEALSKIRPVLLVKNSPWTDSRKYYPDFVRGLLVPN